MNALARPQGTPAPAVSAAPLAPALRPHPPVTQASITASTAMMGRRLGVHHCAYLRAVAEGLDIPDAARRYLGIEHGHQAITAHRATVELARTIARRRGDPRWRLLGAALPPIAWPDPPPTLEAWAEAEGLGDWSAGELQTLYEERFARDDTEEGPDVRRRALRNARLRAQRLALIQDLETAAAERPRLTDALAGWLDPGLAQALLERGVLTLGELQALIAPGGRWWRGLRAFGPTKAARLQLQVEQLIGRPAAPVWSLRADAAAGDLGAALSGRQGGNRAAPGVAAIDAQDDRAAVRAWILARSGSVLTAKAYEREADRFLLWILLERGRALSDATAEDCRAYMDFLSAVPAAWISRRQVPRMAPGWAPFSGALAVASQRQAIGIVHSLFSWLVEAGYLITNPWALVRRRVGDDRNNHLDVAESSRAFTPAAWAALRAQLEREANAASAARMRWILTFAEATGLRAAELLSAQRGHLQRRNAVWWLRVHGKGARNRAVPVPSAALAATVAYFAARGLAFESAPPDTPLLASTTSTGALTYSSLHQTLKRFVARALRHSALSFAERREVEAASTHWLRHTHATRAAEVGVPPDVLQANLGHSDPRTTAGYYKAQLDRRSAEMERVYGSPAAQKLKSP
ncbi:tyrosine-type recombinase/integrase [Variovorax saccharolyticus]|uniref:tyrosine-type recombinase/integrase n=1 Tax=Variovorax saccharolyticus TaxID=3053516 RepID=UPI002574BE14|nr:tyrosine-type recombinase/integrase [Variovorax sp. J31P216]MDM0029090.1 tyrosine-type recombinase/integrase [Variovorax sp. J31P216]